MPTGLVADNYSRRLSIIIGFFLVGVGFVIEGLVPHFTVILLTQVIWGIGITFTSGATEAWIADEVGEASAGGSSCAARRRRSSARCSGPLSVSGSPACA